MDSAEQQPPSLAASVQDHYALAHAVFGSLAAFVTAPGAVLIARYCRAWRHWATVHWILNAFTAIFLIVNYGTIQGVQGVETGEGIHTTLGTAVFVIVLVQTALGVLAKFTRRPESFNYVTIQRGRSVVRYIHIVFGIVTLALLYVQVYTGFDEWNGNSESETTVPKRVEIAFWILFGLEVAAYGLGWAIMEPLGRKKRAHELAQGEATALTKEFKAPQTQAGHV